jgi:hypothetical protein
MPTLDEVQAALDARFVSGAINQLSPTCGTKLNVYISYSFFDALESSMQSPFREPCASPTAST